MDDKELMAIAKLGSNYNLNLLAPTLAENILRFFEFISPTMDLNDFEQVLEETKRGKRVNIMEEK